MYVHVNSVQDGISKGQYMAGLMTGAIKAPK